MDTEKIVVTLHDVNYIPAYKEAETERKSNEVERQTAESIRELNEMTRETNEANRKLNEDQRKAYYEEIQQKVENGEFHGENSVYVGEEEPKEDYWEVWIDPSGNPEVEAKNIYFTDNKTLQQKLDSGELNGKDGTSVTILGSYSTEEELKTAHSTGNLGDSYLIEGNLYVWNVSINDWTNVGTIQGPQGPQGPQGEQGIQGEQGPQGEPGKDGEDGYTPVKGTDYFTEEEKTSLLSGELLTDFVTIKSGYYLSYGSVMYRQGNHYFGTLNIQRTTGYFQKDEEAEVATFPIVVKCPQASINRVCCIYDIVNCEFRHGIQRINKKDTYTTLSVTQKETSTNSLSYVCFDIDFIAE